MKIAESKELTLLSYETNKSTKETSKAIVDGLMKKNIIEDDTTFYGILLYDCLDDIAIGEINNILSDAGITRPSVDDVKNFLSLYVLGDGDCPECGGEMEVVDGVYQTMQADYNSEPDSVPIWEERKCSCCGYTEERGI